MNEVIEQLRTMILAAEDRYSDRTVNEDFTKLINMAKSYAKYSEGFIVEIHVSPIDIFAKRLREIDSLDFVIIYNSNVCPEEGMTIKSMKTHYADIWRSMLEDEFSVPIDIGKISFELGLSTSLPLCCLYSVFPTLDVANLSFSDIDIFKTLIRNGVNISIPNSYPFMKYKSIFLHSPKIDLMITAMGRGELKEKLGNRLSLMKRKPFMDDRIVFAPLFITCEIKYDIPYTFLNEYSFNFEE